MPTLGFVAQSSGEAQASSASFRSLELGLDELESGKPRRVRLDGESPILVWLLRNGSTVRAFAARCPHLGCSVGVAEDHQSFECPCHHARFSLDGARIERSHNPAPRDLDPLEVRIDDGDTVTYGFDELDDLTHAYAISVHRSQGSEYPFVVAPIVAEAGGVMLRRRLLYTLLTRARSWVVLVGERKALELAVHRLGGRRNTGLARRLAVAVQD